MAKFEPSKNHLREVLLFAFHSKKNAAQARRMIVETYGERCISERTCREWFHKFKNGEYDVEDKERPGPVKKFEDAKLETLLDEDSCRTQRELANLLGVTQHAYELKPRDIERRLFTCEQLLQQQNRKGFLHRIVIGDENWIHYDNPKRKKSWGLPGHSSTSTAKPNIHGSKLMQCIWWDKLGVVCYELLQPGETITGVLYRTQRIRLSRALKEKRPQYSERHDKIILLHDNARSHVSKVVKTYLETLKWDILPLPPYSPDIAPSDFYLFRVMTHDQAEQHFRSYAEAKNWIDSWIVSKDEQFFRRP
ncbi:Transposase, type 1 [Cinara cedri]|uniref:Transposase, type 1 n=1 Tax=Cinara cedri TaxID=506608 RepID=A0A5E4M240_9HEMI|nr:Transposase, type 1 [Cinara cedri]